MKVNISATAALELNSNHELEISFEFADPRNDDISQQAKLIIKCQDLLPFMENASPEAFDLFLLASCAYGVDRIIKRRPYSVDGWSRELEVSFPVQNVSLWDDCQSQVEDMLSFLTGDYWKVSFTDWAITWPIQEIVPPLADVRYDQINLFSGGLDSLIGAIDVLAQHPSKMVLLVSQYDQDIKGAKGDQNLLFPHLEEAYESQVSRINSVGIHVASSTATKRETTLRSRSLMFISLGVLASSAFRPSPPVIVPENGSVSLNYPLSVSRRSACSTRTTHPKLLNDIQALLVKLGLSTMLKNPYELRTKGEMVRDCDNQELLEKTVALSNSCGKRGHRVHWVTPNASHCGVCMPCVYRQAALIGFPNATDSGSSFTERTRDDILACQEFLRKSLTSEDIRRELIVNGLSDLAKINDYVNVIERTRSELRQWMEIVEETV